ncbi:hypothetical protein MKX03_030632 [Papaver bracteatum]|nr:hypothetical protein MKX03_030632 [Papaver bracteatum]
MEKKSHDGEERFVIDLSTLDLSASSHDAGVTVNVAGKVLPVANKEECREQETEEDSLSVAAGVTVKAKSEEDSLSTTSTIEYRSDYTDEEYPSETEDDEDGEYVSNNNYKDVRMDVTKTRTPSIRPRRAWEDKDKWEDKDEWVASWKELCKFRRWTWIDVYAYFNKGQGGYGVILRDALAKQ